VEFFRNPNIDFLGKKWYFLAFSLVFSVAGVLSMLFWHHIPLGVDFRGGTLVYVKFSHPPDDNGIRAAMDRAVSITPAFSVSGRQPTTKCSSTSMPGRRQSRRSIRAK
jgi:preprotein translocase subunit SecF